MARQGVYLICYALIIIREINCGYRWPLHTGTFVWEILWKNHLMTLCFKKHNRNVSKKHEHPKYVWIPYTIYLIYVMVLFWQNAESWGSELIVSFNESVPLDHLFFFLNPLIFEKETAVPFMFCQFTLKTHHQMPSLESWLGAEKEKKTALGLNFLFPRLWEGLNIEPWRHILNKC